MKLSLHSPFAHSISFSSITSLLIALMLLMLNINSGHAQGTWTPIATLAPDSNGGGMLLLSDGSVIAKSFSATGDWIGNNYDRLTPDIHGSYVNGTWSHIANMIDSRLYFSSQVLQDARVYVAGGEYGTGGQKAEVYDPLSDSWTAAPNLGIYIGDANTEILPDGRVLQALVGAGGSTGTIIYDPIDNNWNYGPTALGSHNESVWVKLPDNSDLYVNIHSTSSERYLPDLNQWVQDADVPVALYDDIGYETGSALLLPDGRAFFIGSTGHTAYYTPSGNGNPGTWEAGPDLPDGTGTPDAPAAMMMNGKILMAVSPAPSFFGGAFPTPTTYYEFDYTTETYTLLDAPDGNGSVNEPCYFADMLDLPDGSVLYADQYSKQYYVYMPDGTPLDEGKPTIDALISLNCDTFMLTGTLFNGISEGASFGDDWQQNTNYPIIRLTKGDSVYYARTFNWNRTGVQTGTLPDTTLFTLPADLPGATYYLVVIANGIPSDSISFVPGPALSSTLTPDAICSNTLFEYAATCADSSATFTWTRAAVSGISNAEITDPQTIDPNEVLVNTTDSPVAVVYEYTITTNGCSSVQDVTVVVNPVPPISISGTFEICSGASTTLTANGGASYQWSTGDSTTSIDISPTSTTTYSVSSIDSFGCAGEATQEVVVNPLPNVDFSGLPDTACIYAEGFQLTGNPSGGNFSGTGMVGNTFSPPNAGEGMHTVTYAYTDSNGCENSVSQDVYVSLCTGIETIDQTSNSLDVYPNPASELITVSFTAQNAGDYVIKLIDVLGRTMTQEDGKATPGANSQSISLRGISKGQYTLVLLKKESVYKAKLIIE